MKTAITSTGNSLDSKIDQRFGHCSYLIIYDSHTEAIEIIPNPYRKAEEQAGINAAKFLAKKGIEQIISGEFGQKVKPYLDSQMIQMIIIKDRTITINRIIELLNRKK